MTVYRVTFRSMWGRRLRKLRRLDWPAALCAIGFVLIMILAGCHAAGANDPGRPIPNHCTHVDGDSSRVVPCPTTQQTTRVDPHATKSA